MQCNQQWDSPIQHVALFKAVLTFTQMGRVYTCTMWLFFSASYMFSIAYCVLPCKIIYIHVT